MKRILATLSIVLILTACSPKEEKPVDEAVENKIERQHTTSNGNTTEKVEVTSTEGSTKTEAGKKIVEDNTKGIKEAAPTKEQTQEHIRLVEEHYQKLINAYNQYNGNYSFDWDKFVAQWNRDRNDLQDKIYEENGRTYIKMALTDMFTLYFSLDKEVTGSGWNDQERAIRDTKIKDIEAYLQYAKEDKLFPGEK